MLQLLPVGLGMRAQHLLLGYFGRRLTNQLIHQATLHQTIMDGRQALGAFRMARAHLMQQARRV
jgi:hypothetical protein